MIEWRRVALCYPCIACGAPPGKPCVTVTGRISYEVHNVRSEAASQRQWRSPDDPTPANSPNVGHSGNQTPRGEER